MRRETGRLTRDFIDSQRYKHAQSVGMLMRRLIDHALGIESTITCECGKEHRVFQAGTEMSQTQVNAAKATLQKLFPDVSPEDLIPKDTRLGGGWQEVFDQLLKEPAIKDYVRTKLQVIEGGKAA